MRTSEMAIFISALQINSIEKMRETLKTILSSVTIHIYIGSELNK